MKLITDIPDDVYTRLFDNGIQDSEIAVDDVCEMARALRIGTPLDDVKAELQRTITASWYNGENYKKNYRDGLNDAIEILDNIGKESETN